MNAAIPDPPPRPDRRMGEPAPDARAELAARQAELVAALVAGGTVPAGFDADDLGVARRALLRKRSGEVRRVWPLLAGSCPDFAATFVQWADGRVPAGALRDGWDLARELATAGTLPPPAAAELAAREATARYDGESAPRRRRLPAVRRVGGAVAVQAFGRVRVSG